jgi:hypothetical protein
MACYEPEGREFESPGHATYSWFLFSTTSSDTLYLVSNSSLTLGLNEANPSLTCPVSALIKHWTDKSVEGPAPNSELLTLVTPMPTG